MHDDLINPAPFCHRIRIVDIIFSVVCRSDCKTWRYRAHLVLVELRTERNNGRRNVFAAHGVQHVEQICACGDPLTVYVSVLFEVIQIPCTVRAVTYHEIAAHTVKELILQRVHGALVV